MRLEHFLTITPETVVPNALSEIAERACREYDERGVFFLDEAYLREADRKCGAFPRTLERVIGEAGALSCDEEAARYALFVCRAMEHRALFLEHLALFEFPEEHPFLAFLCLVPAILRTWQYLTDKGIPEDVVRRTVGQYEECLFVYEQRFDHLGMNKRYFDHLQGYVDNLFLNVGRLRFEIIKNKRVYVLQSKKDGKRVLFLQNGRMNAAGLYLDTPPVASEGAFDAFFREETDRFTGTPVGENGRVCAAPVSLDKAEYEIVLAPKDYCISVHIPAGEPLTEAACEESYTRAKALFAKHYPQYDFKAFHCHSWMMAPELAELMKPTSGVLTFQRPYMKYPAHTKGEDVLNFVFKLRFTTYEDLPEDTSLQRALKARYLAGGYLYEYCGIRPF